ncbi:MAG: hypothetical protein EBU90_16405 [Proteobacteria bacterium]|nr:hypothetical protein [Pseudomonadota bacterium]
MSNHLNLRFFNKEGDHLNFQYNQNSDRFEGDILFHENSTDTYKTAGLYTLENIPSFEFESVGELTTKKWQLFNERGLHFWSSKYVNAEPIITVEPTNSDPKFYSKFIYGRDIGRKFPKGSLIKFNNATMEFINTNQVYTVLASYSDRIMIVSLVDNATFEAQYFPIYSDPDNLSTITISGVNAFGVYDYIQPNYFPKLSNWNEPEFFDKYYLNRKLNVIGGKNDDKILTVDNPNLSDLSHFEYSVDKTQLPQNSTLIMEILTRTEVPLLYQGPLTLTQSKILIGDVYKFPVGLRPGTEIKIIGPLISGNQNFFTVDSILDFRTITQETFFATQSQTIWNGKIYECVQAYTQSISNLATSFITPENEQYWDRPTYIKVTTPFTYEDLLLGQIYLTTDKFYYTLGWTYSSETTMAQFAQNYAPQLKIFDIDLFYLNNQLRADLIWASKYAEVNFYYDQVLATHSIGQSLKTSERIVGVKEQLVGELNYDYSENKKMNIVFTDLDDFGFKIVIGGQIYEEETVLIYTGAYLDMERTIDRTLRNWLARWTVELLKLGILVELKYTGTFNSVFFNTIVIKSEYPNVEVNVSSVRVGTSAAYYIEHSKVTFSNMGSYFNINIDGDDYGVSAVIGTNSLPSVTQTLASWESTHGQTVLENHLVQITNFNSILTFDILNPTQNLDYVITTGKVNLPGITDFKIKNILTGNSGIVVASNEVILPQSSTFSFLTEGFATGMAFTINNTFYTWMNQDYVIQYLNPKTLNLSYQGPFWGLTGNPCNTSAFQTLAFDSGYGQTACVVPISITSSGSGPYNAQMFSSAFKSFTTYYITTNNVYTQNDYAAIPGLVDIDYIELSNSIYGFGDYLVAVDAFHGNIIATVSLPGNTQSIEMEFNTTNSYLYCLSKQNLYVIDPTSNSLVSAITFSNPSWTAFDMELNPINGDIYISYDNAARVDVWDATNFTSTETYTINSTDPLFPVGVSRTGAMVFNDYEGDMYITTDADSVLRVNGGPTDNFLINPQDRSIQTVYNVLGLTHSIFYEPVYEAIYTWGSASLYKIDNSTVTQISGITTQNFVDVIYNNLTNQVDISDSSGKFTMLDVGFDTFNQSYVTQWGYQVVNQYDGDVYISSQSLNTIFVVTPNLGQIKHVQSYSSGTGRIIFNPERNSIWSIQPVANKFVEIDVEINLNLIPTGNTFSQIGENQFGTLDPNYVPRKSIWLKTREYFRRPRENFEGDVVVQYYWRWLTDQVPEFFMYDFSGEQLPKTGPYAYTGEKPLENIVLNRLPNTDKSRVSYSAYQQTVFDEISFDLSYLDDIDDVSVESESLELFVGFKSQTAGALRTVLQLFKREPIDFFITSNSSTTISLETLNTSGQRTGKISINETSSENFTGRGLKPGQRIVIYITDTSNVKGQYTSENNGTIVIIRNVFTKSLIVDFIDQFFDYFYQESTKISNYPNPGSTTYLRFRIKVQDREIGRFVTYGQTEEEDERFKIELNNIGKLIDPSHVFIFKDYDINEGGIDWVYLNKKRKEMLMVRNDIFPYVGAYKSIINAINYFGYNELQLNEYYRYNDSSDPNFGKLFKVEIPDIFDNTTRGWERRDFIEKMLPNEKYRGTNNFNLTYKITDKEGNYVLNYELDEIIIKLQGLKYWLKRNIIPLTHNITDITGNSWTSGDSQVSHEVFDCQIFNIKDQMTPITFKLNEVYLQPVNSGSTVYNCVLDFYSIISGTGASVNPNNIRDNQGELIKKTKAHNDYLNSLEHPDIFDIKVETYKIYKEWAPYVTYDLGDKVIYFDKIYESQKNNNRTNNPRKYETALSWQFGVNYQPTTIVEYKKDYFVSSGLGSTQSNPPSLDPNNWLKVTEWKVLNYEPVQCIQEQRLGSDLRPFNFSIDSNLDPYLVIQVISHSGRGTLWRDKKNYFIKGLKDLVEPYRMIDNVGPFVPITPVV